MDKDTFIAAYVAAFLGSHTAFIYDDCCMRGNHDRFNHQPVEDAKYIAEKAWNQLEALK